MTSPHSSPSPARNDTSASPETLARELHDARDEIERLTLELHAARRETVEAIEQRDQFVSSVSHELRTPLSSITLWASLLEEEKLGDVEQVAEAVAAIRRSAEEQRELVEDLVDAARIVAGKFRFERTRVDLVQATRAAIALARPFADERHILLVEDYAVASAPLRADPDRIQQLARILIRHAISASHDGGRVTIAVRNENNLAQLSVRDEGHGIAKEALPHLFDRLRRRADSSGGSSGFGLMIARHIAEVHGGTILAESAGPGTGSLFRVDLPA